MSTTASDSKGSCGEREFSENSTVDDTREVDRRGEALDSNYYPQRTQVESVSVETKHGADNPEVKLNNRTAGYDENISKVLSSYNNTTFDSVNRNRGASLTTKLKKIVGDIGGFLFKKR